MARQARADAKYVYFCRVVNTYVEKDGHTINKWEVLYGPHDLVNPARAQFNKAKRQKDSDTADGRLGPAARPTWDGQINIDRTVEMMRSPIVLEEESTWGNP